MNRALPILLLFCSLVAGILPSQAQMPINEALRQTESDHFLYIYQASLEAQIPNLIKSCEDAYSLLTPAFKWQPREKITILYHDAMDEHNGSATVYPRPTIEIYAAGVSPVSSIYEPGNFIRSTVFHELAHVLPLDAQYGADAVLASLFGRVTTPIGDPLSVLIMLCAAPPNALAPNWYLEGLSIWSETEFVGPGRGRNSLADMILRMPIADGRELRPKQWDLHLPEWPYGEAAYLYGMRTIEYARDDLSAFQTDENTPGDLADSVAHSFLASFDSRAVPVTGKTFDQLTREAYNKEKARQSERIEALKSVPLTPLAPLTPERLQVLQPRFGPDGRSVLFCANGEAERDTLYRYDLATKELTKLARARTETGISRLTANRTRDRMFYTRLNHVGRDRLWTEVREYDVNAGTSRRVCAGNSRYRFPTVSPDGTQLVAVRNEAGRYALVKVPLADAGNRARETVLATAPEFGMIVDPTYAPDGQSLVYVLATREGSELHYVHLTSGHQETLASWPCIITSPVYTPDNSWVVFSADRSGVYNLYRVRLKVGSTPEAITHVLGGAFMPDVSPDGTKLAMAVYDSYGYRLAVCDWNSLKPIARPLPELRPTWKERPTDEQRVQATLANPAPSKVESGAYNSLTGIRFDYWTPWLTASGEGAQGGLAAAFSDPTDYQSLLALGGGDTDLEVPIGALVYQYAGFYPIITLYGSYGPDRYTDLVEDQNEVYYDYDESIGIGGAQVTLPWPDVDREISLTLGYQYSDRSVIDKSADEYKDQDLLTTNLFEGGEGALYAQLQFFNGTAFGRSHSVEQGRWVSAAVEQSDKGLGGDLSRTRALGQWNEYLPLPFGDNHVLKLEGLYGTGSGDEIAQGFFGLGGFGTMQADATPGIERNITLRGYDDNWQVGKDIVKASIAWRFPVLRLYEGVSSTMPLYFQQLFGEVFYEGGKAWGSEPVGQPENDWVNSAGIELNFSTTLFRLVDVAPGVGVAYAFDRTARKRNDDDGSAEEDEENNDEKLQPYISIKAVVSF